MAQLQDIGPVYRGEDVALNFTMVPTTDITGWTISFRLKFALTDAAALLTVSASVTSGTAGTFTTSLTAAQTTTLSAGSYKYDVWRTDSGSAAALAIGNFEVKSSVKLP